MWFIQFLHENNNIYRSLLLNDWWNFFIVKMYKSLTPFKVKDIFFSKFLYISLKIKITNKSSDSRWCHKIFHVSFQRNSLLVSSSQVSQESHFCFVCCWNSIFHAFPKFTWTFYQMRSLITGIQFKSESIYNISKSINRKVEEKPKA